jgi:hypothetical protein
LRRINFFSAEADNMSKLTEEEKEHIAAIKKFAKNLHDLGWKTITFQYSAHGDSINELLFTIENEEDVFGLSELAPGDLPVDFNTNTITNHFIALLPTGFENGDGGAGEIELDTKSEKITVRHTEYYTAEKNKEWML